MNIMTADVADNEGAESGEEFDHFGRGSGEPVALGEPAGLNRPADDERSVRRPAARLRFEI